MIKLTAFSKSPNGQAEIQQIVWSSSGLITIVVMTLFYFFKKEYLNNTRPYIGAASLDGGRQYYDACLRWHTTTNLTAKEIFNIGVTEVNRIRIEMEKV